MKSYKAIGLFLLGAALSSAVCIYVLTGADESRWEKVEISGYGARGTESLKQCYLIDEHSVEVNCPVWVRDQVAEDIRNGTIPPAYWVYKAPANWKYEKAYIFKVEHATQPVEK